MHHASKSADAVLIHGNQWGGRTFKLSVGDLHRAIEAHGGNQTAFGKEVFGHPDGRQVRRWLDGKRMSYTSARKLSEHIAASSKPAKRAK